MSQSMKKYIYTSKLEVWVEFLGDFFCAEWYWYTSIESKSI
jgi:hypothetical protein